jgi:hypothetical protein
MTPKIGHDPIAAPTRHQRGAQLFKCLGCGNVQGEVIDAPAVEHRPLSWRRDLPKLEHVQRSARADSDQRMSAGTLGLGNRELNHLPGPNSSS